MNETDFYLTLLSNSSMSYFSNNKTTNFITKLPKIIKLAGHWSVSIVEFQYPCSLLNVQENENKISLVQRVVNSDSTLIKKTKNSQACIDKEINSLECDWSEIELRSDKIPSSNYEEIEEIILALNSNALLWSRVTFSYNKATKIVSADFSDHNIISLRLSNKLSEQLGFDPFTDIFKQPVGNRPANLHLGWPSQMFIYSDVSAPQIVGDVMAPLLRIVSLDTSKYVYGTHKMITFTRPFYIPIIRREFDTIEIDIRTETGSSASFEFGTTCIKLHFKKLS